MKKGIGNKRKDWGDKFKNINIIIISKKKIVVYLTSLCVNWAFFGTSGPF
jgi:hypothetical protein